MTQESHAGDDLYGQLSEIKPPRGDVATQEVGVGELPHDDGFGSLADRMKLSPKMSDTQVVDRRLFPILKEKLDYLNNLPVARVFPETINPLRNILVKELLQTYEDMSFAEAISIVEVALTIAIDGEGRMDIIHLFSKMSDNGDDKDKGKLV